MNLYKKISVLQYATKSERKEWDRLRGEGGNVYYWTVAAHARHPIRNDPQGRLLGHTDKRSWSPFTIGKKEVHSSHNMKHIKGVFFCSSCFGWATRSPKLLIKPCRPIKAAGRQVRRRLEKGLTPSPGLDWPSNVDHIIPSGLCPFQIRRRIMLGLPSIPPPIPPIPDSL